MTVAELRDKLAACDGNTRVVVYRETETQDTELFEIDDISIHAGTPSRDGGSKARFRFATDGAVKWLFVSVEPA